MDVKTEGCRVLDPQRIGKIHRFDMHGITSLGAGTFRHTIPMELAIAVAQEDPQLLEDFRGKWKQDRERECVCVKKGVVFLISAFESAKSFFENTTTPLHL